jgi:hypothetical protein
VGELITPGDPGVGLGARDLTRQNDGKFSMSCGFGGDNVLVCDDFLNHCAVTAHSFEQYSWVFPVRNLLLQLGHFTTTIVETWGGDGLARRRKFVGDPTFGIDGSAMMDVILELLFDDKTSCNQS